MSTPAGQVGYPEYLEAYHEEILVGQTGHAGVSITTDAATVMNAMLAAANPYEGVSAYDPDEVLSRTENAVRAYENYANNLDATSDWDNMVASALLRADDMISSAPTVEEDVQAYEIQARNALARAVNRVAAGFSDINAVVSTAFPTALALVEQDHLSEINRYRTDRFLSLGRERALIIAQSVSEMVKLFTIQTQAMQNVANAYDMTGRFAVMANMDRIRTDIGLQVDETNWDMTILAQGSALIGSMSGITPMPQKLTPLQNALSGALTGAAWGVGIGVSTGSLEIGVAGLLAGGIAGGLVGGMF